MLLAAWHEKLKRYQQKRPGLRILDSFEAVMKLTNRISMLDPVREGFLLKVPTHILDHILADILGILEPPLWSPFFN